MILALECDYCDESEGYQQIQFGNANNLRLDPIRAPILRLTIFMPLALDGVPVCCPPVTFHPTRAALFRLGALLTD